MMRVYGQDVHIPAAWLGKGVKQIALSLNSHQHENWMWQNNMIVGSVYVDLAQAELVLHQFSSQPIAHLGH
ncbi:hypothetical protein [Marinifaba aquimaris]|uniref:hypothetical protein n=1 Tax=Marinifaba aquimaris TaxID=2741323 RepID=UPI001FEAE688|nr:hypothetical protein [Marinifaba aquimaris]